MYTMFDFYTYIRFACPVTVNLRVSQTDLEFHGYHIPKKTQVRICFKYCLKAK